MIQLVRPTDGTRAMSTLFDADTGAGTQNLQGVLLRRSGAGGSVEMGTSTEPVRTDPTGTTTQPVSGTVTANQGTANATPWNENLAQIGGAAFAQGQRTTANSVSMTLSSDHGTLPALAANQSVNVAQWAGVAPTAAAALADNIANPTTPAVGAVLLQFDGSAYDRVRGIDIGDGVGTTGILATGTYLYNGATFDRVRSGSATSTQPHYAAALVHHAGGTFTFLSSISHTTTTTLSAQTGLGGFNNLVVTWNVTAAERDSANETYDLYVTCGDGVSAWDVAHFPQIITTGAKRFTAFIHGSLLPQNVTTAVPGVAANEPGTFKTDTASSDQGTRTLAAGVVRHGALGDRCGADIVIAGTIVTGITHSITFTIKP